MRAALIGAFWGVGHTLTIFVVGAGIILFNLVNVFGGRAQHGVISRSNADYPGRGECSRVSALNA